MNNKTNDIVCAYISGACTLQTKCGGWGIVLTREGKRLEKAEGESNTTNNRMALTAAIKALQIISKNNSEKPIVVATSSQYVVDGMNTHLKEWKQKQWRKSDKKPVLNEDLWKQLDELNQSMSISWVKESCGHIEIGKADALAKAAKPTI
ncbi:ribonuclease HI [Vibrio parahaemolyticus]